MIDTVLTSYLFCGKKRELTPLSEADRLKRAVIRNREYLIKLIQFVSP